MNKKWQIKSFEGGSFSRGDTLAIFLNQLGLKPGEFHVVPASPNTPHDFQVVFWGEPRSGTYRIMASHCTDPEEKDREFEAANDDEAWAKFEEIAHTKNGGVFNYGMDFLRLLRVDVKEETTYLGYAEGTVHAPPKMSCRP